MNVGKRMPERNTFAFVFSLLTKGGSREFKVFSTFPISLISGFLLRGYGGMVLLSVPVSLLSEVTNEEQRNFIMSLHVPLLLFKLGTDSLSPQGLLFHGRTGVLPVLPKLFSGGS